MIRAQPLIVQTVRVFPALILVAAAIGVAGFLLADPERSPVEPRLPGEGPPQPALTSAATSSLSEPERHAFDTPVPAMTGRWPNFRGPDRNAVAPASPPLARQWPEGGPPVLWTVEMGEGYAGAAVWNGRVFVLDYDAERRADVIRCLSLATGDDIWRYAYPVVVKRQHGMSRTIPATDGRYVVTLGPKCHVTCLDAETGNVRWSIDLVERYGTKVPQWYAGQCPVIDEGRAIIAPGASALAIAVDCDTGEVLWETPNPKGWAMSHTSLLPMTVGDRRVYIYAAHGGVAAIDASDGRLLWQSTQWRVRMATVPTPVDAGDGRVLFSGGYKSGSLMVQLEPDGEGLTHETLFRLTPAEFGSDQQTPVFYGDHFYGVLPAEHGAQLVCFDTSGRRAWASGYENGFGLGPYIIADGLLFVLDDYGVLTMAEATPEGFNVLDRAPAIPDGHDAWGPPAFVNGLMIVRDLTRMTCLDLRQSNGQRP